MASLQPTHTPILNSRAQVLILPVNTAGILLDPVLLRSKSLYPDNHQRYRRACLDGSLMVGSCLLHKRALEITGLGASNNGNQPRYIANLVISDHPYHATRTRWLSAALLDLRQQLMPMIRYHGVRKLALLGRPLTSVHQSTSDTAHPSASATTSPTEPHNPDWHTIVLPLLQQHLQDLPKVSIDLHLPRDLSL